MISSELWIIYALFFGATLLGVQGLYWLLVKSRSEKKAINRRLVLGTQLASQTDVLEALRKERGVDFLDQIGSFKSLNEIVIQTGLRLSGALLLTVIVVLSVPLCLLFAFAFGLGLWAAAPLAFLASVALLYLYLRRARARRIAAFAEQLPDALDVLVRGLKAGHPFRVALGLVAREMPDPAGTEFGILADEIMFGLGQSVAVQNLCQRVGQDDLTFFSIAISIQSETGGNLGEILGRLSHLMRNRSKLRLKIRSLSAEGRLSGIALSLAPFVLFGIITLISPDYFLAVKNHPVVPIAAAVAGILLVIGNVMMYRMVNFKF